MRRSVGAMSVPTIMLVTDPKGAAFADVAVARIRSSRASTGPGARPEQHWQLLPSPGNLFLRATGY